MVVAADLDGVLGYFAVEEVPWRDPSPHGFVEDLVEVLGGELGEAFDGVLRHGFGQTADAE